MNPYANPEARRNAKKRWAQENKDKVREYRRRYNESHREHRREKEKERSIKDGGARLRKYYLAHRQELIQKNKEYRLLHKREKEAYQKNYRAKKIKELDDWYIRRKLTRLGIPKEHQTPALMELKRQQIISIRNLREVKKHESVVRNAKGKQCSDANAHESDPRREACESGGVRGGST